MSAMREGTRIEAYIVREQFTRYDREELHPECANDRYLEQEQIKDSVGKTMWIDYGYKVVMPNKLPSEHCQGCRYLWIDKESANDILNFTKKQEATNE